MDRIPYRTPRRWWSPLLRPRFIRWFRPYRIRRIARRERLIEVEVRGVDIIRAEIERGHGVMIVSKHVGHVDPYIYLVAGDQLGTPFYYMAGWQVFEMLPWLNRLILRMHGCFSVDRESNDLRAFRQAVDILQNLPNPFVTFAEGEIWHHNDVVFPFRPGAAAIALAAAKRAQRPIVCVPAGMRYLYAQDPLPALEELMDALERHFGWQPRRGAPLGERLVRVADAWIAQRETEFLGGPRPGDLPARIGRLLEKVLSGVEERQGVRPSDGATVPDRVTPLRQHAIKERESALANSADVHQAERDLEEVYVATQLYSYTRDWDATSISTERLAEIMDKLEEDILEKPTATLRADRRAALAFGEPIPVAPGKRSRDEAASLTKRLEEAVLSMVQSIPGTAAVHHLPLELGVRPGPTD